MRVVVRLTRHNRNSAAALAAVLERELAAGLIDVRMASEPSQAQDSELQLYSFMTPQAPEIAAEIATLQQLDTPPWLAAGGPHPSGDPDGTLAMGFDAVFTGEAGSAFAECVRAMAVDGRRPTGIIHASERATLDRYPPWPASGAVFAQAEITRGCPMRCTFCQTPQLMGRQPRHRSVDSIHQALEQSAACGHKYARFVSPNALAYGSDDGRTPNLEAIESLLTTARRAGMRSVFFGTFPSEVRPESITDEALRLIRELADNPSISLGLQSGSDAMLKQLERGHTVQQGIDAVERIVAHGFTPQLDFIFGLPGETDEQRQATRKLIFLLSDTYGARVHAHPFMPLPGSALADAPPGAVDDATVAMLEELRGDGLATGACARPKSESERRRQRRAARG